MSSKVEIKVNGKSVDQYEYNGSTFIEAREGTEYTITIKNNDFERKLAIVSVDGINVISGQAQGNDKDNGYVINGYGSVDIKGFRRDLNTVGAFKFCKKEQSYCNEKGLKGNNGVIGIRIYKEKQPTISWSWTSSYGTDFKSWDDNSYFRGIPVSNTISTSCVESTCYSSNNFDMGTTWGKKVQDEVKEVSFESEVDFQEIIIYYDTRKNLEDMGISFKKEKYIVMPQAFGNFAEPPKGWEGK